MKTFLLNFFFLIGFVSAIHAQNVGVGTAIPSSRLSVKGNLSVGTNYSENFIAPVNGLIIEGFTGIGTPAPQQRLHIRGTTLHIMMENNDPTNGRTYMLNSTNAGNFRIYQQQSSKVSVDIDQQGNVGIGTFSITSAKVNLGGNVKVQNNLRVGDGAPITGPGSISLYGEGSGFQGYVKLTNNTTGIGGNDGGIIGMIDNTLNITNYENHEIRLNTNNLNRLVVSSAGHFHPATNNVFDLGTSTNRFRDVFMAGRINASGAIGTYGSISIAGSKNSYSGIEFPDAGNTVFMVRNTDQLSGVWRPGGWVWYFNSTGVLTEGTVPWGRLSGTPTTFTPSAHTHNAADITVGTLPIARGGTGAGSFTADRILTGNGTGAIQSTLQYSPSASVNTLVQRNVSGYIYSNYIHTTDNVVSSGVTGIVVKQGNDFHRTATKEAVQDFLGIKKVSVVQTLVSPGWNLVTHNFNIPNVNFHAVVNNGDQSANNFNIEYWQWQDNNRIWVYVTGGSNGGSARFNVAAF